VVGRAGASVLAETLQLGLHLVEGTGIEQLAQLLGAEELAEQIAVECECGRAPLRQRRVAFVHVDAHPPEEQGLGERRRVFGIHRNEPRAPGPEVGHHLAEGRHVEHVAQALARRLQQDREVGELRRLCEQVR